MADSQWNPVQEARAQYPGLKGWTDDQILKNLSDPKKFRAAFPQYASLSDDTIQKNMSRLSQPSGLKRFLTSAAAPFKGVVEGFNGNPTDAEKQAGLTSLYDTALRPVERVVEAQAGKADEAIDAAKHGEYRQAVRQGLASLVPILGPWVADATQEYTNQVASGDYAGAAGTLTGNTALAVAPKVIGAARDAVPVERIKSGVRSMYGAGNPALKESVAKTAEQAQKGYENAQEANQRATERTLEDRGKVDQANAEAAQRHQEDVEAVQKKNAGQLIKESEQRKGVKKSNIEAERAHAAKTAETDAANKAALREQSKIAPTQQKLQSASEELRARIETAREKAKGIGNQKYNTVNAKLNEVPANKGALIDGLVESGEKIKGSQIKGAEANPRILQDIETRIQNGDEFTYEDLQGYYSELNGELTKGTLPGDVYAAYDTLHDAIGKEMQRIADEHGYGQQLTDARNYWRRMKQTFGKPWNPTDAANATAKAINPDFAASEAVQNRLRLLGSFDPEIPKVAQHIDNLRKGEKALGEQKPLRDILKSRPPKPQPQPIPEGKPLTPEPAPPEPKPYGEPQGSTPYERPTVDVRDILSENVRKRMEGWKTLNKYQVAHLAAGAVGMVLEALTGRGGMELPTAIYGSAPLAPIALARLAENPVIREWLTRPQPGQLEMLESIPNADRVQIKGALAAVVNQAAKQGRPIPVAPAVAAALGMTQPKKRVASALSASGR